MPYTPEHKLRSRKKILSAAGKLFSERGFENITIDEIMAAAGMTRGTFYAHFVNKDELYAESITAAAENSLRAQQFMNDGSDGPGLFKLAETYLSRAHIDGHDPCPLSFLVTDVVNREPQGRLAYTSVYKEFAKRIAGAIAATKKAEREQRAYAITALLIGGVVVGRAISNDKTADALLASCLKTVQQLLDVDTEEG